MMAVDRAVAAFPSKGTVVVCSDLQGNLRDFLRMEDLFKTTHAATRDGYLLFLGDLIHGHREYTEDTWPEWLGPYYADESIAIMERLLALQAEIPGRVLSLLGNHEHSQIGGMWLGHYSEQFELDAGSRLDAFRAAFNRFPLIATAPCGIVFSHASPSLQRPYSREEIASVRYSGDFRDRTVAEMVGIEPLGTLVWSRIAAEEEGERFLSGLAERGVSYYISVCGHDPVEEGYDKTGGNQLVLSTSYRMREENKTYLRLDLSATYATLDALRIGHELLPLYG